MSKKNKTRSFNSNNQPTNDGVNQTHNRTNENGDTDSTELFGTEFGQELTDIEENSTSHGVTSPQSRQRAIDQYKRKLGK